ncbi:hypothetical protein [Spirosoma endophyticum]|uniref:Uncharacterized protein n=1 Tax=Spirosoma endophyticum TaxID=662367 RepID=A0A1I1U7V6_9BACT|nr:hypothetical protein [Spirosoma endophyticum]SFD65658.1 hypothetical protein SAMN05216167_106121 [Spirosoma endophyticum]
MPTEFIQKRRFSYRKFGLYSDRLLVEQKTISQFTKFEIKLDQIGSNLHYQSDNILAGKVFLYISIAIPLILTIANLIQHNSLLEIKYLIMNYILWLGIALANYLTEHQDDIILTGGSQNLFFYRNIPDEQSVLVFIDDVISASKSHMRNKYTKIDSYVSEGDFINRLQWLLANEIISEQDFAQLREEYRISRLM